MSHQDQDDGEERISRSGYLSQLPHRLAHPRGTPQFSGSNATGELMNCWPVVNSADWSTPDIVCHMKLDEIARELDLIKKMLVVYKSANAR